ncbi:isoquinoline 1-oxidoreductase, alpha subunit [Chryseolinea serpens]|uniref:Isoquinoline 1-oxidoreductase, alpha subunit n=1 Tax=Chryseolinea serpens TaxID=947013 RepID=A0A1M5VQ41_9BACT|nr:(2Fe-2S)-binding protein [Chryseolinea serpens]SHH77401.1 isoquinoline 1-oxidoreductase, alpha subunit [Chryseolinea serpens]
MKKYTIKVNHKPYDVEAEPDVPLLWILRDYLGLKGTKFGCGIAACGACTIHLNNNPVRSCQLRISTIPAGAQITTIEGIGADAPHPVQEAWVELQVPQCGYCQSGQIMSAVALLARKPMPSDKDIDAALAGNLCRCGTYDRIRKAIHLAAGNPK